MSNQHAPGCPAFRHKCGVCSCGAHGIRRVAGEVTVADDARRDTSHVETGKCSTENTGISQIDCPLCGVAVKQVASATLSLALWQHFNWWHNPGEMPSPPLDTQKGPHEIPSSPDGAVRALAGVQDIATIAWRCIRQCKDHQPPPVMCVKHQLEAEALLAAPRDEVGEETTEPDSREWWQAVAQGLGIRCFDMGRALDAAWQDIHDWMRFARELREKVPNPNFSPLTPTEAGIAKSEQVLQEIAKASNPREASSPSVLGLREIAERIVREHDGICVGAFVADSPWCSAAPDGTPLCTSCAKLVDRIVLALCVKETTDEH